MKLQSFLLENSYVNNCSERRKEIFISINTIEIVPSQVDNTYYILFCKSTKKNKNTSDFIIKNKEKRPLLLIFDSEIYVLMAFSLLIDSKLWTKCLNHIRFSFTFSLLRFQSYSIKYKHTLNIYQHSHTIDKSTLFIKYKFLQNKHLLLSEESYSKILTSVYTHLHYVLKRILPSAPMVLRLNTIGADH